MIIDKNGCVVTQKESPSLVLLTPEIKESYLIIKGSGTEDLKIKIKKSPSPGDKFVTGKISTDTADGIDCGDEAAVWFQSYLKMDGVRLIQFFPNICTRKYIKNNPFMINLRKTHPASFQNVTAFHVVSKSSVDDINSKLAEKNITAKNFRPNIVIKECEAFAEDSWKYMKFNSGTEMVNLLIKPRCLITTNDPNKGILSKKEPLATLRKYRIPTDPEVVKITGSMACLGICCGVLSPGEIKVGNDVFAVVGERPKMMVKEM